MIADGEQYSGPRARDRVIRDPIHDYIDLPLELNGLIDEPEVQRLRRISQTAMSAAVYPAMTGSRFEHSLGAMHLAGAAWRSACDNSVQVIDALIADSWEWFSQQESSLIDDHTNRWIRDIESFTEEFVDNVDLSIQAAALLHDLGHPPFSHALEGFYLRHLMEISPGHVLSSEERSTSSMSFHEVAGRRLLKSLDGRLSTQSFSWFLTKAILSRWEASWVASLHDIVSGEVDVDRIDYLMRDSLKAGTEFGAVDIQRLLDSIEIHPAAEGPGWVTGFGVRALSAIEGFLDLRLQYYRWVVFHPHCVAANRILALALDEAVSRSSGHASDWVHQLDYFTPLPLNGKVNTTVDDSTVLEVLKRARSEALESTPIADARLICLVDATLDRRPNWAPVWKTERDYSRVCQLFMPSIYNAFNARRESASQAWQDALSNRLLSRELDEVRSELAVLEMLMDRLLPPQSAPAAAQGMNLLARCLLGEKASPEHRLSAEILVGEYLDSETNRLRDAGECHLPQGNWIVAYESFSAVRMGETGTAVFDGQERVRIREASTLVEGLQFVEKRRTAFFAYYVATDGQLMRVGRESLYKRQLAKTFAAALPSVILGLFFALSSTESFGDDDE